IRETPEFRPASASIAPGAPGVPVLNALGAKPSQTVATQYPATTARAPEAMSALSEPPQRGRRERSDSYYDTKSQVFAALIDTIDLSQLAKLEADAAREEIRDIVNDIIAIKNFAMSISEQEELLEDIC